MLKFLLESLTHNGQMFLFGQDKYVAHGYLSTSMTSKMIYHRGASLSEHALLI